MRGQRDQLLISAFASVLLEARQAAGYTQQALADRTGLAKSGLEYMEAGKRQPSLSVIFAIAGAVGQTPVSLIAQTTKKREMARLRSGRIAE